MMPAILPLVVLVIAIGTAFPAFADPLDGLNIAAEGDAPYDRNSMYGSGWRDDDRDCQNARRRCWRPRV